ncbi:dolichyl-phosphate-mannose-protein mannosyltransferase [Acetobacter aceti NBRC 14818]|nr:glycosyltransferase family 39 protein [Acetobacter aceti]TCS33589.1 dolichyl-phosphate-mannose-protein mannosyltransferase [Acetobacter aceti NBRC 14818]
MTDLLAVTFYTRALTSPLFTLLALLLFAVLCRFQTFGNPFIHVDEEFYLFVGGRMLHGDLPYVQLWDRKPLGLFLLYAFFHLFGTYRIWAYQIFALFSVWGTSLLLVRMARSFAPPGGALMSGLLYIACLNLSGGEGGQSPVFYNLLVTAAMAHTLFGALWPEERPDRLRSVGMVGMALFGLAIQIKYTAVFEGIFLGCFLLWCDFKARKPVGVIATDALLWVTTALAPTFLAAGFYALIGHGHEWFFANIQSIFLRQPRPGNLLVLFLLPLVAKQLPLIISGMFAFATFPSETRRSIQVRFIFLWAAVSLFGVLIFGDWFDHYALPTYAPLAVIAAPLWRWQAGRITLSLCLLTGFIFGEKLVSSHIRKRGNADTLKTLTHYLSDPPGCIFIYRGPPTLYDSVSWCALTTHPFPSHFYMNSEKYGTGIDPLAELHRIMSKRPLYVVSNDTLAEDENMDVRHYLDGVLATQYHLIYQYMRPADRRIDKEHSAITVYKRNSETEAQQLSN